MRRKALADALRDLEERVARPVEELRERFLRGMFGALTRSLEIVDHTDKRLVVWSGRGPMTFDRNYRTISRSGRVIARFDAIRQVEIKEYSGDSGPFAWAVRLRVAWWRSIHVGRTTDDMTASICAATCSSTRGSWRWSFATTRSAGA